MIPTPFPNLVSACTSLGKGDFVILVDDDERENEGDLILNAQFVDAQKINFMSQHGRGLICLALEAARVRHLELPLMPRRHITDQQAHFTVSIEARSGVTTGMSAADRAHTIQVAINPQTGPADLATPGHVFPLCAEDGGVLTRRGHTEGAIDLMKIAQLAPSAVICEILREDGTMARMNDLELFSTTHRLPIISLREIVAHRFSNEEYRQPLQSAL